MKKIFNKSISISFITILFIITMGLFSSSFAGTVTVNELWDKCTIDGTNYDVYCTEIGRRFDQGKTYTIGDKYEVTGNIVKKNGTEVAPGTDEYKYALKMAYILATPDTVLSASAIDSRINVLGLSAAQKRPIYNGIYDLTSIRQTAIWMTMGGAGGNGRWKDTSGNVLRYYWDLGAGTSTYFVIVRNADGTYSFSSDFDGVTGGVYTGITNIKFPNETEEEGDGNKKGYYKAAVELKNAAAAYTGVESEIENITSGDLTPDYSNDSYIKIGPIKLRHNSAIEVSNIEVYDENGSKISGTTMEKVETSNGSDVYIKIDKGDSLPLKISKVKVKYESPRSANSTWYKLTNSYHQTLAAGKGSFSSLTSQFEIDLGIDLISPVQIVINKVDTKGNNVNGPKFEVVYSNDLASETKTVSGGRITFTKRTPTNTNQFTATITEKATGSGYKLLSAPIVLQFMYNSGKWDVTKTSGPEENVTITTNNTAGVSEVTTRVENKSQIDKLTILKTNSQSSTTKVAGAKFNIKLSNVESIKGYSASPTGGVILLSAVTTDTNGNIALEDIVIKDLNDNIIIEIEEIQAPSGYRKIDGKITVTLKREGDSYTIHTASKDSTVLDSEFEAGNVTVTNHQIELNIKNIPIIQELVLEKLDARNDDPINGAKFKVELGNVKSIEGETVSSDGTLVLERTISNGKFSPAIENIELKEITQPLTIILTEEEAPLGYKKIDGTIIIEVKLNPLTGKYEISGHNKADTVLEREFNGSELSITNNKVYIPLKDIPTMNIGGVVWKDEQTGVKGISGPDGLYNNDNMGMDGIKVFLIYGEPNINSNGQLTNTPVAQTVTSEGGKYLFEAVEVKDNYHVVFKYDGMSYEAYDRMSYESVEKGAQNNASKVDEIGREDFNQKFYIVEKDKAISTDGTETSLEYSQTDGKSELVHNDGSEIKQQYVMYSESGVDITNWSSTWTPEGDVNEDDSRLNINCGLTYRFFDLALGTDVKEAKVSINGKTVTYDYAQIMNGVMEDLSLDDILEGQSSEAGTNYNLYLYTSDYYYRIGDYKTDGINETNQDASNYINNEGNELEVEVTYTVMLKNQSKINAIVNEFVYYYDENYTPLLHVGDTTEPGGKGYKVTSISNNKIIFESVDDSNILEDPDFRKTVDITFRVNKDANGVIRGDYTNTVEITRYSTFEEGIIDVDSAPGNGIIDGHITHYEDDTDEAKGIKISIKDEKPRIITGTVWDDGEKNSADADGLLEASSEKVVDDVIVQLIEVKNISGVGYCEYIWQETRSGNNEVKTTARNGYAGTTYRYLKETENKEEGTREYVTEDGEQILNIYVKQQNANGEYKFVDFIPGNYIIRFIYGDGETYDVTRNVEKYNGQDYQSTIDEKYKASWYNTAGYGEGQSVARDNEARRLEVMAYSTIINEDIGHKLKEKNEEALKNTWMCAETSRINVPVDADRKATEDDATTSSNSSQSIEFSDINFGLALRPQTKLTLEKHITSLKIVPTGVGSAPVVDAKVNIEDILDNGVINNRSGVTDGLATIVSDRNNRGFWKVETDIEELAQGATLEIEYTYVIVNDSDKDYLSSNLVNIYKNNISIDIDGDGDLDNNYPTELLNIRDTVKNTMKNGSYVYNSNPVIGTYLGEYYYTGRNGAGDTEVLSNVDGIEESLNEQFGEQTNVGDYFTADNTPNVVKTYIDANGNTVPDGKNISTVLKSKKGTDFLTIRNGRDYDYQDSNGIYCTDWSRTAKITTVLSSVTNGEIGGSFPSYIAEMTSYSNAAGRRNMNGTPGDLSYVHSEDTRLTLDTYKDGNTYYQIKEGVIYQLNINSDTNYVETSLTEIPETAVELNGLDEFWGETIIISKPTGEDKQAGVQIAIITTISVAILGVGIVLIKKLVLKK